MHQAVRIVNGLGSGLEKAGLLSSGLTTEEFSDELESVDVAFGDDELQLRSALHHLTRACDQEASLTPVGRLAARRQILELLDNLARLKRARTAHVGIAAEQIRAPIFITGLPRTGSTLLHALLAQDPGVRVPETWEVMRPPIGNNDVARSVRYTERRLRWAHRLAPQFQAIHPIGARLPQECIAITAYVFRSVVFHTTQHVPSYQNWLENQNQDIAYRFHRRFLQNLQFFRGKGQWVLKAPGHMFSMDALFAAYPDATILQTHRDPIRVAASLASHTSVLRSAFSNAVDSRLVAADWLERWWRATDRLLDARADRRSAFIDIYYRDIARNPLRVVERIYEQLGWRLPDHVRQRMQEFLIANPKGKHGVHRYSLEKFGIDKDMLHKRLDRYRSAFSIADEPL